MLTCAATILVATDDGLEKKKKNEKNENKSKGTKVKKEKVVASGNVTIFHENAPSVPKTTTSVPLPQAAKETGGGGSKVSKWKPVELSNPTKQWEPLDTTAGQKWAPARDVMCRW